MPLLLPGPLALTAPIGRGGMGMVWRGVFEPLDMPVAVKVMHSRDPRVLATFHNEIRAVAGLDHPNIVTVHHQGRIPEEVAAASGGQLRAGALYLVMELVEGGSIRSRCGRLRWPAIRTVLMSLLAALAHAHSRGVIHRDIKPGNVLIGRRSTIGRVRLTDFGLARDLEETDADAQGTMGTPRYMAPEQTDRRWRDLGPWTDLYALGRVAQALVCGAPGWFDNHEAIWTPLPDGFQSWLTRMLAPEPTDRFQCAADAAFALQQLRDPPPTFGSLPPGPPPSQADSTINLGDGSKTWSDAEGTHTPVPLAPMCPRLPPPFPIDWRMGEPVVRPLPVIGLGLFGLRTPPLLGRNEERDALWGLLREAAEGERRVAVVQGEVGVGKSRLVRWLVERAEATGAASTVCVPHSERGTRALERALSRSLGVTGLPRAALGARVELHLRQHGHVTDYEREALTEILAPAGAVRFDSAGERYAVILRTLRRLSLQRPLILWLEDVQWGADALGLVQHILFARRSLPLLVVVTWTEMADRPLETEQIAALTPDLALTLEPLPPQTTDTLTHDILRLSPPLADRLARHSSGNPMLATQIATDWVERSLLQPGPGGFFARPAPPLPDCLRDLWRHRAAALLEGRTEDDVRALELAAVIGGTIDPAEWAESCRAQGIAPEPDLTAALLDRGLARQPRDEGWMFCHWLFREALEQHALEHGRLQQHHRSAAALLADHQDPGSDLRAAHHMLAAGDDSAALHPLLTAARRLAVSGAHRQGLEVLHTRTMAMERLGLATDHTERLENAIIESYFAQMVGQLAQAVSLAEQTAAASKGTLRIRSLQQLARLRRDQGRLEDAAALVDTAEAEAEGTDPLLLAHCRRDRAAIRLMRGDLEAAEGEYTAALEGYLACGADRDLALVHKGISRLSMKQGRFETAAKHIEAARELHTRLGGRLGLAGCLNALGEIHRAQGALDDAERCYRAALSNLRDTALSAEIITEVNLALVLIARDALEEADDILEESLTWFTRSGRRWMLALLYAYRLPGLAARGDFAALSDSAERALAVAEQTGVRDADAAALTEKAAQRCRDAGRSDLADRLTPLLAHHLPDRLVDGGG